MNGIKAIETQYKGYRFRSRLEARWAVFFDALGIEWQYEPEGFDLGDDGKYLPDFWLPTKKVWVEVKGKQPTEDEWVRLNLVCEGTDCVGGFFLKNLDDDSPYVLACDKSDCHDAFEISSSLVPSECLGVAGYEDDFGQTPYWHMICPFCGFEQVHFEAPIYQATDSYDAWEGRGSALRIPMWCESGHRWELLFGFHKGDTYSRVEKGVETEYHPLLWLANGNVKSLDSALVAARSARFEHGENGAPQTKTGNPFLDFLPTYLKAES